MDAQPNRWAFVVPGESIAVCNPALVMLLEQTGQSWEDFIYLSTAEVLGYINNLNPTEFQTAVDVMTTQDLQASAYEFHSAQIDKLVTNVMEGFDLVDTDVQEDDALGGVSEMLSEKQYAILYPAVLDVLKIVTRYIALMFKEPREDHGIPYEITLDRLIGKDLVFTITYR
jgi:hypothetical protein